TGDLHSDIPDHVPADRLYDHPGIDRVDESGPDPEKRLRLPGKRPRRVFAILTEASLGDRIFVYIAARGGYYGGCPYEKRILSSHKPGGHRISPGLESEYHDGRK